MSSPPWVDKNATLKKESEAFMQRLLLDNKHLNVTAEYDTETDKSDISVTIKNTKMEDVVDFLIDVEDYLPNLRIKAQSMEESIRWQHYIKDAPQRNRDTKLTQLKYIRYLRKNKRVSHSRRPEFVPVGSAEMPYGLTKSTLASYWMKSSGYNVRLIKFRDHYICKAYLEGTSVKAIAKKHKLTTTGIYRILKLHGGAEALKEKRDKR